ncbi:MAG: amidohydrolase family protein [Candidatus Tectomicrobia bacterium]|nr:amidohydrolase family protein [Candidatus Tectomicrobia bacterium]
MAKTLIRDIDYLLTDTRKEPLRGCSLLIDGPTIGWIGREPPKDLRPDRTIDGRGHLFLPGLINTHHHFFQSLTRNLPQSQDAKLFDWITENFKVWRHLDHGMAAAAARTVAAELLLSGCTTSVDHCYMHPRHSPEIAAHEIQAVREMGLRFHLARGSLSPGFDLHPDIVQDDDLVHKATQSLIEDWHEAGPFGMTRICVGPCSLFNARMDLYRESRKMADSYPGVQCHTHLAETRDEDAFCLGRFGKRPFDLMEEVGWVDGRCFHAHSVWLDDGEVGRMATAGAGVAHCPVSNMRLGSGIAPIVGMLRAGVHVGLGVDGSASNDASHLFDETRQSLLIQRIRYSESDITARDVLTIATRGGAAVLGRDDIGTLAPGKAADVIGVRLNQIQFAGAVHDYVAALIFCGVPRVDYSFVNGEMRVEKGEVVGVDLEEVIARQNEMALRIVKKAAEAAR